MSQSGPGRREVAYRLFAAEFDDAELSYSESDEERAPNYVVTPTGARINRLFAVGVLTEVEDVNPEMVRGRVVDPTGAIVTYAGQYQPDALAFLERVEPPTFLALSGKARTYEPDDGDRIFTSVRPEAVNEVDAETRDRWVITAAERTLERIGIVASAVQSDLSGEVLQDALSEAGVDERLAEGVTLALDHYRTTPAYLDALRELAIDAVRVVADERDEAGSLELAPDEGDGDATALATLELSPPDVTTGAGKTPERTSESADEKPTLDAESVTEPTAETGTETAHETGEDPTGADGEAARAESTGKGDEPDDAGGAEPRTEDPISEADMESVEEELEDFDPDEFELDEKERRDVEEEFGTEFSTAGEVDSEREEPASSEPDSEPKSEPGPESKSDPEREPKPTPESGSSPEPESGAESNDDDGDIDLVDTVIDAMERLDEGDGADRAGLVSTVADERSVDADAVEAAIQDALMSGRCYEPVDGKLKSI